MRLILVGLVPCIRSTYSEHFHDLKLQECDYTEDMVDVEVSGLKHSYSLGNLNNRRISSSYYWAYFVPLGHLHNPDTRHLYEPSMVWNVCIEETHCTKEICRTCPT